MQHEYPERSGASALALNLPDAADLKVVIDDLLAWARAGGILVSAAEEKQVRRMIGRVFVTCSRTEGLPVLNRVLALALRMFVVEERHLCATQQTGLRFPRETAGVRG